MALASFKVLMEVDTDNCFHQITINRDLAVHLRGSTGRETKLAHRRQKSHPARR